ncbi:MFS transporter [Rhodococcus sp. NPDC057529]|uniref:MFS transporter n=1 Tax=Rhodococcus sp. NPDC057529 TaxID=3346158 RepID=UPI00366A7CE4
MVRAQQFLGRPSTSGSTRVGTASAVTWKLNTSRQSSRLLFPVLAIGAVFQAILQTIMVPLLPSMPGLIGVGSAAVSWLVTSTLLVGAVVTPIFGRLADMVGKKRMLLISLTLMTGGSMLCAISSNIAVLILARGLQGVGAVIIPIGISILREELRTGRVPRTIALLNSTLGLGVALGVPFSAAIIQWANWHVLFWVTTAIGASLTLAAAMVVGESRSRTGGRFDGVGAVGLSSALVCLLVPTTQGSGWGWTSPAVVSMFVAAAALFVLWGRQQLRNGNPLVDLQSASRRALLVPHLVALLVGFAFYGNTLITTQLLQADPDAGAGYSLSILLAAVCLLPVSVAMMTFAFVAARFSDRRGPKASILVGSVFLVCGYALHAVPGKPLWLVVMAIGIAAIGTTFVYCTLPLLILAAVPLAQAAAANSVNVLLLSTGTAVCSAVIAPILTNQSGGQVTAAGFASAYIVCAVCAVVVTMAGSALPKRRRSVAPDVYATSSVV